MKPIPLAFESFREYAGLDSQYEILKNLMGDKAPDKDKFMKASYDHYCARYKSV